jgi:presequence protease
MNRAVRAVRAQTALARPRAKPVQPFSASRWRRPILPRPVISSAVPSVASFSTGNISATAAANAVSPTDGASLLHPVPLAVGESYRGFLLQKREFVADYAADCLFFVHEKTGAEIMSILTIDENKTFGVVFKTPPDDSNGIAHIMEHSVLCGSKKYPLKEPFVELLKGSLNTFLNAFTYPDRTCYPVASCNTADFYNLIDVYMDAVFFPRAISDPNVLAQEGWHYELNESSDELIYKGVVFNEMKGVYSNPDSVQNRDTQQALFPDNAYGLDSGGDPRCIPHLDFEYFQSYHARYYHPSNSRIWFYGNDEPLKRLDILAEYLDQFEKIPIVASVMPQPKWDTPRKKTFYFAASDYDAEDDATTNAKKGYIAVSWLLTEDKANAEEELGLGFLNYLLMGTSSSTLRKALMDSGLGSSVIGHGMDHQLLQATFSAGLKDVAPADAEKVEALIMDVFHEVAKSGFTEEEVVAAINIIEFTMRENNTGDTPRGLVLMLQSMTSWLYGKDPFESLYFERPLAELKARIKADPNYFQTMVRHYFLDNSHRLTIEHLPSSTLGKEMEEEERARLAAAKATMSEEDIQRILADTIALKEIQETPDSAEVLAKVPAIKLSDIPRQREDITPKSIVQVGNTAEMLVHDLPTNGLGYVEFGLPLNFTSAEECKELLPYLPILCRGFRTLGTSKYDEAALNQYITTHTGGLAVSPSILEAYDGSLVSHVFISGKATVEKARDELLPLFHHILVEVDLNNYARFKQMVSEARAAVHSGIIGSGHSTAASTIGSTLTVAGWINEQMSGVTNYRFLSALEKQLSTEEGWPAVQQRLKRLRELILANANGAIVGLTSDNSDIIASGVEKLVHDLGSAGYKTPPSSSWVDGLVPADRTHSAFVVPSQVNYVGKGSNLYQDGYKYHGSASVASKLLGTTYLWDHIRVSGGAYGGFCSFNKLNGNFVYLSYRDPNLLESLETYDRTGDFLREIAREIGLDELNKSIIGTMGDVDRYQLPDAKGSTSLTRHIVKDTDEAQQVRREQILSTKASDFLEFADILDQSVRDNGVVSVVGMGDAIEKAKETYDLNVTTIVS